MELWFPIHHSPGIPPAVLLTLKVTLITKNILLLFNFFFIALDEQVVLQRHILELSSRGYTGKVDELEDVLRSVDLDVEKASIILDLSKDL